MAVVCYEKNVVMRSLNIRTSGRLKKVLQAYPSTLA